MTKLFDSADAFIRRCRWHDIALLKLCLCAMGIIIGLFIPSKKRKPVFIAAMIVFLITYVPLMVKYCMALKQFFTDRVEDSL